jgi:DNA-binding response OmpR family regulator
MVDMELPDGNGRSIIDRIRCDGRFKHTRLVAVSGDRKYDRVESGNFRADMFLLKPVSIRMVQALLDLTAKMPAQ